VTYPILGAGGSAATQLRQYANDLASRRRVSGTCRRRTMTEIGTKGTRSLDRRPTADHLRPPCHRKWLIVASRPIAPWS
jgi:hypothetical protein